MTEFGGYHVKLSRHFIRQAAERLEPADVAELWNAIADGRIQAAVGRFNHLRHTDVRVAVPFERMVIIAVPDRDTGYTVTLLTILLRSQPIRLGTRTVTAKLAEESIA